MESAWSTDLPSAANVLNLAIHDAKDFPLDIAPQEELYCELLTGEGRLLFECAGLIKPTGIDIINCPLDLLLKLNVRRRLPQGALVLWHVLLPLSVVRKHLLEPPHDWETWLGLFPNTQSLEALVPESMFTQAVHLISRPEFPKLRLRFTYHNPAIQHQAALRQQSREVDQQRRTMMSETFGKQQFHELHNLTRGLRSKPQSASVEVASTASGGPIRSPHPQPQQLQTTQQETSARRPVELLMQSNQKLQGALTSALHFISDTRDVLEAALPGDRRLPSLTLEEVLASSMPGSVVEVHCQQLQQCIAAMAESRSAAALPDEKYLAECLRYALTGMLEDSANCAKIPRTATNLSAQSADQLASVRSFCPALWEVYRDVSRVAMERLALLEQVSNLTKVTEHAQEVHKGSAAAESAAAVAEKLLYQREALQRSFEKETGELRRQLTEAHQRAEQQDGELSQLRASQQLSAQKQNYESSSSNMEMGLKQQQPFKTAPPDLLSDF